ncbi:MAG: hypothetical protein M1826_003045 [Phylliscum demangeonii]|nr:MAG: hypothetical protein M1826_003045 [Phylliscum demangeonii]
MVPTDERLLPAFRALLAGYVHPEEPASSLSLDRSDAGMVTSTWDGIGFSWDVDSVLARVLDLAIFIDSFELSLHVLFPHIPWVKEHIMHLTDKPQAHWVDQIILSALCKVLERFHVALLEHARAAGRRDPRLRIFRDPVFFILTYHLKLQVRAPTLEESRSTVEMTHPGRRQGLVSGQRYSVLKNWFTTFAKGQRPFADARLESLKSRATQDSTVGPLLHLGDVFENMLVLDRDPWFTGET